MFPTLNFVENWSFKLRVSQTYFSIALKVVKFHSFLIFKTKTKFELIELSWKYEICQLEITIKNVFYFLS